nr:hypothetical protein [Tanacetum cinerariifolium]
MNNEQKMEKRLKIGKCNGRLNPGKIQREPTFQVILDALALTLCYSAFLITADVPEVYMHHPEMKETQAYQTYLGFAIGATPPKKRHAKKSTETLARGVVIRETLEMPLSKKKEKSMRDFHKTHPSGSGTVTKTVPSVSKIKPSATSEGTSIKPCVPDVAEEESLESKPES